MTEQKDILNKLTQIDNDEFLSLSKEFWIIEERGDEKYPFELKLRLAKFFSKIIENAKDKEDMEKNYLIITSFISFKFNDELDSVTSKAGELEVEGNQKIFDEMKTILKKYIKEHKENNEN